MLLISINLWIHKILHISPESVECTGFLVVGMSTVILFFDIAVPNELKGFLFYAQVSHR